MVRGGRDLRVRCCARSRTGARRRPHPPPPAVAPAASAGLCRRRGHERLGAGTLTRGPGWGRGVSGSHAQLPERPPLAILASARGWGGVGKQQVAKCRASRVLRRLRGSRGGRSGRDRAPPAAPPEREKFYLPPRPSAPAAAHFPASGERDLRRPAGAGAGERREERRGGARSPAREGATGEGHRGGGSRVGGGALDKGSPGDSAGLSPQRREWEAERERRAPRAPPHRRLGRFPGRPSPSRERRASALPSRVSLPGARRAGAAGGGDVPQAIWRWRLLEKEVLFGRNWATRWGGG